MNILCIYLGEGKGGAPNTCICMERIVVAFITEPLDGCL